MNLGSKLVKKGVVLILLASFALTQFGCSLGNPQNRLNRLIDDGKYDEALEYYREKRTDLSKEESELAFEKALDMMYQDYLEGKIDNEVIVDYVDNLTKLNSESLNSYGQKIVNDTSNVEVSRENYDEAEDAFERGDYLEAIDLYGQVIKEDSNYETAQEQINECKAAYKDLKTYEAAKYADKEEYLNALNCIKDAVAVVGTDSDLNELLADYQNAFDEYIFNSVASLALSEKYDDAIKLLTESRNDMADTAKCDSVLTDYKDMAAQELLTQNKIDNLIADGKYVEAIEIINTIKEKYSGSPILEKKFSEVSDKYVESELEIADGYIIKHDYEAAYAECVEALKHLPNQSDLVSKRDYCSQRFPVSLNDCYSSCNYGTELRYPSWAPSSKEVKDHFSNVYEKGTIITSGRKDAPRWTDFYLNDKYSILSLGITVYEEDDIDEYSGNGIVRFYGDDELIYEMKITDRTTPDKFDVDVTGVTWLRIECSTEKNGAVRMIVVDPILKYA